MSELNKQLMEFQKRFEGVSKERKNTFTDSSYANLDDVWNAAQPLLSDLGLLAKDRVDVYDNSTVLECTITHVDSDESFSSRAYIDDDKGPQVFGSELSYKKRYLKCTMLNIVENNDDDGNAGMDRQDPKLTEKQHSQILDLIDATETDISKFAEHLKKVFSVEEIEHLTIRQASTVTNQLKTKLKRIENGNA